MHNSTVSAICSLPSLRAVGQLIILLSMVLLVGRAWATTPPLRPSPTPAGGRSLAEVLTLEGTLRPGATGSFNAAGYRLQTAPDGKPLFRTLGTAGAGDQNWQDAFGPSLGPDAEVRTTVVAPNGDVYIGGMFRNVGNVSANYLAKWDGTTWSSLGTGLNGAVYALAVDGNGNVYAGGNFTTAGGISASRIARWNGTAWSSLGTGLNSVVQALALDAAGNVYAGGYFTTAGGVGASGIAKWNGTAWSSLGGPPKSYGAYSTDVLALAVDGNGNVYASCAYNFVQFYDYNISRWNGSTWNDISFDSAIFGYNGPVYALKTDNAGNLYAGGNFQTISGVAANNMAKWNGTAWSSLGAGPNSQVNALAVDGSGNVYAGGFFTTAGGVSANRVARWNGTTWSSLGPGLNDIVWALALDGSGNLYAGGVFMAAGGLNARRLAKWNGSAWSALNSGVAGEGMGARVRAVALDGAGNVYVGGDFTTAGSISANFIAKWNGTTWSALGTGLNANVNALAVDGSGNVYAGGGFTIAGGLSASRIAKWDGTTWSTLGTGLNSNVATVAVDGSGNVYAGGEFTAAGGISASRIAKWNGTAWSSLGTGMNGGVEALVVDGGGQLYAGGYFTTAGGVGTNGIAKWNGTAWSALGTGVIFSPATQFQAGVTALAVDGNGTLYAGGSFTSAGGTAASYIAQWNGTAWSSVGSGTNAFIWGLAVDSRNNLYAGGDFTTAGGTSASRIAKWDGTTWSTLGTGLNALVFDLTTNSSGQVYAGGNFTAVGDGSKPTLYFGIYNPATPPVASTWTGTTSTDWFAAGNWTAGVPTATLDATVPAGAPRYPVIASGTALARNLTLAAGASLTLTAGTLNLQGQFSNNGTFSAAGGSVEFTGALGQGVSGSSGTRFWNLRIGAAGAALGSPVTVQGLLTLDGNLSTNGHILTLESTSAQTALVVNSGGSVLGNVTVQRAISSTLNPGLGYRHYSSPVQNTTVADLATNGFAPVTNQAYNTSATPNAVTPFPTVFGYNQNRLASATNNLAAFDQGWFSPAATDPLLPGHGYTVNIDASQTIDFVGSLQTGPVTVALARNSGAGATAGGWALLGNPYPAPVDWSLVDPADRPNLDAAMYVFESSSAYGGQYRSYVNGIGNPVLPMAQGFFARVSAGQTAGTLTFRNTQRLTAPDNNTPFQRSTVDLRPLAHLELRSSTGLSDTFYAYAETGATPGADAAYDAVKLPNTSRLNVTSQAATGEFLAIDGRPSFAATTTLPLTVAVPAAGNYTLTAAALRNLPTGLDAYLTDVATGQITNLSQQPAYVFGVSVVEAATPLTGRFILHFATRGTLATASALTSAQVAIYPNPAHGAFQVNIPAVSGVKLGQIELLNNLGQVVRQQAVVISTNGASFSIETTGLAPGVYTLHLQAGATSVAKRIVIQ
ncbi:T9SS type A sorting domain-containing protein [Hymenobacter sediminicola]|uniref:T9SS type A sorting domain-containing protein n=1 Tax=Hymenobacter sediminicola TaxID=2761579 RepID=A0A7G7W8N5_9BACT|nr:T9SS type A sorting domain-containing protein [Hymenobacter sediminicola]QNH62728.1 T9SS type A sorting domain-containing protein [Hymenobacter sediminicola]